MTDAPEPIPPPICACKTVHGFDCQFTDAPAAFHFNGQDWCRFHLPLENGAGDHSDKDLCTAGWERGGAEWEKFETEVLNRLTAASNPGRSEADLRHVAFPPGFSFHRHAAIYPEIHGNFEHATFGNNVNFDKITFRDRANFIRATFTGSANFNSATFGKLANFTCATFGGGARFGKAIFGDFTSFSRVKFMDIPNFDGTTFGNSPNFKCAKFMLEARFSCSKFGTRADFTHVTFKNVVRFDDAKLGDRTSFTDARFLGEATFSVRDVDKANPKFQRINFSKAKFFGFCSFENRKFTANASFNDAEFHDLVKFHGCTFHQGMSFHGTKFLITKGDSKDKDELNKQTGRMEQAYRTLKLGMETLRARSEEAMFFALEMECRHNRSDVPRIERFAATLYKNLSDYGRSVDLPLLWLLVLANVSFLVFGIVALATDIPDSVHLVGFTFEQMFRPFYVWSISPVGTAPELVDPNPTLIPVIASLQSLATLSLLALFLLALRRRFKMD